MNYPWKGARCIHQKNAPHIRDCPVLGLIEILRKSVNDKRTKWKSHWLYLKDLFHWRLRLAVAFSGPGEENDRTEIDNHILLVWLTYDVCWKILKGRKEMVKVTFGTGHWRLQVVVSTVCKKTLFTSIMICLDIDYGNRFGLEHRFLKLLQTLFF